MSGTGEHSSPGARENTVGIVGAGRFGTALARVVATGGRDVVMWSSSRAVVDDINQNRTNRDRLRDVELPALVHATTDPAQLAARCRLIVLAVGSSDVEARARVLGDVVDGSHFLVHAIGALAAPNDEPVSAVLRRETPCLRVGALAGPALPRDLVDGRYAAMVCASEFDEVSREARRLLAVPPSLHVVTSRDLRGVELAAALSGAYTIAIGIAASLELGPGPRAVLITRAVYEAGRIGAAAGADSTTFSGLAGLGNLLVRSSEVSGAGSRDFQLGLALGRGEPPPAGGSLPEGAHAAGAGVRLAARHRIPSPVLAAVAAVLDGRMSAEEAAVAAASPAPEA